VPKFAEFLHGVKTMVHVQWDEGFLGMGRVANEMSAEGEEILTKISDKNEMANERALYFTFWEIFQVGHVVLNEFYGVFYDCGKVHVVSHRFVLREHDVTTYST